MENTTSSINTISSNETTEVKVKRTYTKRTPEERAARKAAFEAHKAEVAAKKEAAKVRKAAFEALQAERRLVNINMTELLNAAASLSAGAELSVAEARSHVTALQTAARAIEKQLFHRSPKTVVKVQG